MAMLEPGDTILGMDLKHGGHFIHGTAVNISGKFFNAYQYEIDKTQTVNYDQVEELLKRFALNLLLPAAAPIPAL